MLYFTLITVIAIFFLVMCQAAFSAGVSLGDILVAMNKNVYILGHNYITFYISGYALPAFFYFSCLASWVLIIPVRMFLFRRLKEKGSISSILFITTAAVFAIHLVFFISGQFRHYVGYIMPLKERSVENRIRVYFGHSYSYAKIWRECMRGEHRAVLITDYDLSQTLEPYAMGYYLYPALDILVDKARPVDYAVIFDKQDAAANIPPGFTPIKVIDDRNILAVRSNLEGS